MLAKLILLFARKAVAVAGAGAAAISGAGAIPPSPMRATIAAAPGEKDPAPPPVTLTLVQRRRLHVDPLDEYGGRVPCGPFEWHLSNELLAKLDIAADSRSAWVYPIALGQCAVTVTGAKRETTLDVAIVDAIPATLNLVADEPEVFRSLATARNALTTEA
jgi:hypothetical protein